MRDLFLFLQLGVDPFHGVCILGFNAPEWHISCLGSILAWYDKLHDSLTTER